MAGNIKSIFVGEEDNFRKLNHQSFRGKKKVLHGSAFFCFPMRSLSVTTGPRWLYVNEHRSRRIITMIVWSAHGPAITRASACKLAMTYKNELCSAVMGVISWYLLLQATLCTFLLPVAVLVIES